MFPSKHLALGFLFASALMYFFPQVGVFEFLLILSSTFFIDVDHYFFYIYKKKSLNLEKAYQWFVDRFKKTVSDPKKQVDKKSEILIFHGIEFWTILIILSFFFPVLTYILIGIMFHILLDWIALLHYGFPLYFKISQTYTFIKNKNKKDW